MNNIAKRLWHSAEEKPLPRNDDIKSDYFLTIPLDSDIPTVLTYIFAEERWTSFGGDTQRVRYWQPIDWIWVTLERRFEV